MRHSRRCWSYCEGRQDILYVPERRNATVWYRLSWEPLAALEALGDAPRPSLRPIERIMARAGRRAPPLRLARRLARSASPGPQAQATTQRHHVDGVGPRDLQGDSTRYDCVGLRDAFDLAGYMALVNSRKMEPGMAVLVRAWQPLGLPQQVPCDHGHACWASAKAHVPAAV